MGFSISEAEVVDSCFLQSMPFSVKQEAYASNQGCVGDTITSNASFYKNHTSVQRTFLAGKENGR